MPFPLALMPSASRLLLALLVALAGCSEAPLVSECVPGFEPDCAPPPGEDEVIAGVNVTALFARPTPSEVDAAPDAPAPTTADARLVALTAGADGTRRFLLALEQGETRVLSALVRVPGGPEQTTALPVVVVLPNGTDGASAADLPTAPAYGALPDQTVQVVMAYRGEGLTIDGETAPSDLAPDPYRADVADVRALLAELDTVPRADVDRVALVGVGRGGTVALLAAGAVGSLVDAVVTLGAPTDLFAPSFADEVRTRLRGGVPPDPYPALDALAAPALALRDGTVTPAEARRSLLALSPCLLYTSPSPRDRQKSRMPSSA